MQKIRVVTVAGHVDRETAVAEQFSRHPRAELVLRCLDRTEVLAAVRGARVDLVVIVGVPTWLDPHAATETSQLAGSVIGLASDPLEAEAFRRLAIPLAQPHSKVTDLLDVDTDVPEPVPNDDRRRGRVIAVWGPKGAPGRTTIAIELASEMAASEARTALIDGDTYGGDIVQILAVVEELPTIVWAAQAASEDRLDEWTLETTLRRAGGAGPVLLPGINRSELWTDITTFGWSRLLEVFEASFAFTVVDVGFGLEADERAHLERDRLARHTIRHAHHTIAVCRADPVGIKTFLWSVERLKELRDLDDVCVVANRVSPGDADEVGYVLKKHLGKRPIVYLPARVNDARLSIDRGISMRELRPSGDFSSGIRELASVLGARVPARGFLTRLGGRS